MRYRRAVPEDAEILAALRIQMLCEKTPLERENLERIRENTRRYYVEGMENGSVVCWVADDDEAMVGMGCATFFALPPNAWCPDGKTAYLGNIYVVPEHRRQGIASCILARLTDEAKARGCERILLNATAMGKPLYLKHGFEDSPSAMAMYPFEHANL